MRISDWSSDVCSSDLDGQALVFHDYDLHRLTGGRGAVREKVMTDLAAIHLAGTEQPLVNLQQLVQSMGGESSMLVEVKSRQRTVGRLCRAVLAAIQGRGAQIAVMSFNPEVSHRFAENAP